MEVIMVTVIIVLLLSFALFFYFKFYKGRIERIGSEVLEEEAGVLLANFLSMPEFQCTQRGVYRNCVDIVKLDSFMELMRNDNYRNFYINYFGWKTIKVEQVYPGDGAWLLYDNKKKAESKIIISSPISLYEPNENKYSLGKLMVEVYG